MRISRSSRVPVGTIILAAVLACAGGISAAAEDNRPAELKVLDRWVGDWDMDVTIKPSDLLPQGSKSTFRANIRWTVNNRFLRCDAEGHGVQRDRKFKDAFTWIATYDPHLKRYTSTVFWANVTDPDGPNDWGGGYQAGGKWDEQTKSLTIKSVQPDGMEVTSVTKWIDADTHAFVQTVKDGNGKVILEMSGNAKRRK